METLWVVEQGAEIGRRGECLVVRRRARDLTTIPVSRLDHVGLCGNVQITAQAVHLLLEAAVPLSYLSFRGRFLGQLSAPIKPNAYLRREQYRRADDPEFCLGVGKEMLGAKLANQRIMCGRWGAGTSCPAAREAAQEIRKLQRGLPRAADIPQLMGIEGAAARHYYQALAAAVADGFTFERRTRRPPQDPVSLLLGLVASLLQARVFAAVSVAGLDPYVGFVHGERYGEPGLVLDLMEEFRPPLVEAAVVAMVRQKEVRPEHFEEHEGAILLTEAAVERIVTHFERRLGGEIQHPVLNERRLWREWIEQQARWMARRIALDIPAYPAFAQKR